MPNQRLTVPFKIIDVNNKEYKMKYKVGFIGCNQNKNNEVYPVAGWIVSPNIKEEDDEEDDVDNSSVQVVKYDKSSDEGPDDDDDIIEDL